MSDDKIPSVMEYSSDVTDAQPPAPLPEGRYVGDIVEVEVKVSQKGNHYVAVGFLITPDQYPVDFTEGNPDGTKLYYNRVQVSDDARGRFQMRKFCETIDAPMGRRIDVNDWMGKRAYLHVKNSEYEGMPRAEIAKTEHL